MRIAEYKKIDVEIIEQQKPIYDEDGNVTGYETVMVEKPVMAMVYRDATAEEEAEAQRMAEDIPPVEPTIEEQLADLSDYVDVLTEMVLGGAE